MAFEQLLWQGFTVIIRTLSRFIELLIQTLRRVDPPEVSFVKSNYLTQFNCCYDWQQFADLQSSTEE